MTRIILVWPVVAALAAAAAVTGWLRLAVAPELGLRVPTEEEKPKAQAKKAAVPRNMGMLIPGPGKPSRARGTWPQFRGHDRSNIVGDARNLARAWPPEGPKVLWRVAMGEGYAGAAVRAGRVYVVDYDQGKLEDAIRCLSLDDGREIWRYTYYVKIKRNHGMSRTVPAISAHCLVAIGPKCHVTCLNATTGRRLWRMDMASDFGTAVPAWYAGQCPLLDGDRVILAPGADPLMMAVDLASGKVLWRTPNPGGWGMTHSSIAAMDFNGQRQYVYCTTNGVVGVAANDGKLLWTKPDWKIKQANSPTPLVIGNDRILFTGSYNAGSCLIRLKQAGEEVKTEEVFRLKQKEFACEQQTPILYQGYIYGLALPKGELVCLGLDGKRVWSSGVAHTFERGPLLLADGLFFVLHGQESTLHLVKAQAEGYAELAHAKVLEGHEAWAPMAMAGDRLILRDLKEMVCIEAPTRRP